MIVCKEDLINTYIENDYGELRDLYIEAMNIFGIRSPVEGRFDYLLKGEKKYIACMTEFCRNGQPEWSSNYCEVRALKKLTLSDLKPTKQYAVLHKGGSYSFQSDKPIGDDVVACFDLAHSEKPLSEDFF